MSTCLPHFCLNNSDNRRPKYSKDPSCQTLDVGLPKWVALKHMWKSEEQNIPGEVCPVQPQVMLVTLEQ